MILETSDIKHAACLLPVFPGAEVQVWELRTSYVCFWVVGGWALVLNHRHRTHLETGKTYWQRVEESGV